MSIDLCHTIMLLYADGEYMFGDIWMIELSMQYVDAMFIQRILKLRNNSPGKGTW